MKESYVIGIDQSTQGTKAIILDSLGRIKEKTYIPHRQIVDDHGWVSHDGIEIARNTVLAVKQLMESTSISLNAISAIGISNQRETTIAWNKVTGIPVCNAIVWQCSRAKDIVAKLDKEFTDMVKARTGIPVSPFFPAAKAAWIMKNVPEAVSLAASGNLCIGTIDSWLVYCLTDGKSFYTDYSNASRTQLFNLHTLHWDEEICSGFGIPISSLPQVMDSDAYYGETSVNGLFASPIPIHAVLGDSHAALFGQGCINTGMAKATYGTGSSIMMNIGDEFKASTHGLVTSLAWSRGGRVKYVFEGNINYSGAIISWLQNDIGLISSPTECEDLARKANPSDETYLVPAFSGLGAPYWIDNAKASFSGMSRTTGRAELVKAGLEAIAYQVSDIIEAMSLDSGIPMSELRVDGGPTENSFLMQFQSDLTGARIRVPSNKELSAIGAAVMAGNEVGLFGEDTVSENIKALFTPKMDDETKNKKISGWKNAIRKFGR